MAGGLVGAVAFLLFLIFRTRIPIIRRLVTHKPFAPFRGWGARPHEASPFPVVAGTRPGRVPHEHDSTAAVLEVRTGHSSYHPHAWRLDISPARPLVPVVYVDGHPVSWGWGVTRVTVPAGMRLVAVGSSHSRCYRRVEARAGERITLRYSGVLGAGAHAYRESDAQMYEGVWFGPRRPGVTGGRTTMVVWTLIAVVAGSTGLGVAAGLLGGSLAERIPIGGLLVYGSLAAGICGGSILTVGAFLDALRPPRPEQASAPVRVGRPEVRVLDCDTPEALTPAPGWSALSLYLRYELAEHSREDLSVLAGRTDGRLSPLQWWRGMRIGESEPPDSRPWIPAPRVSIDGVPIDASWTRMWLQVPPGEHRVDIAVDPPWAMVGASTRLDLTNATGRYTVRIAPGETEELRCVAVVDALPTRGRPELVAFRATFR
ncbi:hypothetical protein [Nocardia paucivorans]|uniref:hypothetical protein n=1 Tax=Nocardia paucivorans TaxID=114259 RepID=UPI0005952E20|nr:hypothetical protein [Nocardia paucivorans]